MTSVAALIAEARRFLDRTCPYRDESAARLVWGEGSDRVNILEEVEPGRKAGT